MRLRRQLVVRLGAVAIALPALAHPARAYESHFTGDDVRVSVDDAGIAHLQHVIAYRVLGGALKGFDVTGIEPEAIFEPEARVTIDGEAVSVAHVERKGDRALHVTLDPTPRPGEATRVARRASHLRGTYVIDVRYAVDLARAKELTTDGAMWRLTWTAPVAQEGYDAARVVFDLPAAPTAPSAINVDGGPSDDGRVVTLRRGAERDELEMARPHVARTESAAWIARLDPRALPHVTDPALRPPPATPAPPASNRGTFAWIAAALAGIAFGVLARAKSRAFASACEARGVAARGVVPWSPALRAWSAGGAAALAIVCEHADLPAWGAAGIALAMAMAAHRAPKGPRAPRGPGQWLALTPGEAFGGPRASDALDASTRAGKVALAIAALGAIALGLALRPLDPAWGWLVPLDALALLALVATGSRAQLPPDRAEAPRERLAALHRMLKRDDAVRVAPWARIPTGATRADELRLLVLPRAPIAGVVGIEIGVAWIPTPAGYAPETEVLVRVRDDSAAAARLVALAPTRRAVPGRKPEERVIRLVPALGTRRGAVALVRRIASELRDRRKSIPAPSWLGAERRLPPNERIRASMAPAIRAALA